MSRTLIRVFAIVNAGCLVSRRPMEPSHLVALEWDAIRIVARKTVAAALERLYIQNMRIVWDERKRQANLEKHAMDFATLDIGFLASAILRHGHSGRTLAFGRLDDDVLVAVVLRPLGSEAVSVISMRPASARERNIFDG